MRVWVRGEWCRGILGKRGFVRLIDISGSRIGRGWAAVLR